MLVFALLLLGCCFVVVVLIGSPPSDKFSLVPVKTGSLLVSHFGSPWFLLINCVVAVVVVVIVSALMLCSRRADRAFLFPSAC